MWRHLQAHQAGNEWQVKDAVQHAQMISKLGATAAKCYNLPSKTMEPFWVTESQRQATQSQMDHDMEDNFGQVDHGSDSDDDFLEITQSSVDSSVLDNWQAYLKKAQPILLPSVENRSLLSNCCCIWGALRPVLIPMKVSWGGI